MVGADFPGCHPGQPGVFLIRRAVGDEQLGDDRVAAHRPGQAHPSPGEFLGHRGVALRGDLRLAPGPGDRQPEDPHLLHLLDELVRVDVAVLKLPGARPYLTVDEFAYERDDGVFFLTQPVHVISSDGGLQAIRPDISAP